MKGNSDKDDIDKDDESDENTDIPVLFSIIKEIQTSASSKKVIFI